MFTALKGFVRDGALRALYGATVEVRIAGCDASSLSSRAIDRLDDDRYLLRTTRDGAFEIRDLALEQLGEQVSIRVAVRDDAGAALHEEVFEVGACLETPVLRVDVRGLSLRDAKLPAQPRARALLSESALELIVAAALREQPGATREELGLYQAMPPLMRSTVLLDLADGVLAGHVEDHASLRQELTELERWSQARGFTTRELSSDQAHTFLETLDARLKARGSCELATKPAQWLQHACLGRLGLAVLSIAGDDLADAYRMLGALDHQLAWMARWVEADAVAATVLGEQAGATDRFKARLRELRGPHSACADRDPCQPRAEREPSEPRPWQLPADPGVGDRPRDYFQLPERFELWHCLSLAWLALQGGASRYRIIAIQPPNACVGDTITIEGENLIFDGERGEIMFSSATGSMVPATRVLDWTETSIRVVVPRGARRGPLSLRFPDKRIEVPGCTDLSISFLPAAPTRFEGGPPVIRALTFLGPMCSISSGRRAVFFFLADGYDTATASLVIPGHETLRARDLASDGLIRFDLPAVTSDTRAVLTLVVRGHCGTDRRRLLLMIRKRSPTAAELRLPVEQLVNWHGNIRRALPTASPRSIEDVVDVVRAAHAHTRLHVAGSAWSYSECVTQAQPGGRPETMTADWLIRTERVAWSRAGAINPDVPESYEVHDVLCAACRRPVQSTLGAAFAAVGASDDASPRLVHVMAGIRLATLSWLLKSKRLAMATLGGSNGQTLAGAVGTGTHGANPTLPPISDFVRAIHLVGPDSAQWWIEPASRPVTSPEAMAMLKAECRLDPCLNVVYDDDAFDACLVSFGATGVIVSMVVEAAPEHQLCSDTSTMPDEEARRMFRDVVLGPQPPFFAELVLGPHDAHYTERFVVSASAGVIEPTDDEAGRRAWVIAQLSARVVATLPFLALAIARALGAVVASFGTDGGARRMLENFFELQGLLLGLAADLSSAERLSADAAVRIMNLLWGVRLANGRDIVRDLHALVIDTERPVGRRLQPSYTVYNKQTGPQAMTHGPFERMIESYEYVMDAERVLDFVDEVRRIERQTMGHGALTLTIIVRVTRGTRAMMGMQQFARTGYAELWTPKGMDGNGLFHRQLENRVRELPYTVIPHWGHYHRQFPGGQALDFGALYRRLDDFQAQLAVLNGGREEGSRFHHEFTRARGLVQGS